MAGWQINNAERLRTLREFGLLDSAAEEDYDEIAAAAADLCATPVALVTLLDSERQWFKARVGTDVAETPIELAICLHTLEHGEALSIPDLAADARTAENPLVSSDPKVRFYAGVPLITNGQALGTLCVLDLAPRPEGLSETQRDGLAALAGQVVDLIERR